MNYNEIVKFLPFSSSGMTETLFSNSDALDFSFGPPSISTILVKSSHAASQHMSFLPECKK